MESEASETGAMCIQLCTSLPVFGKSLESLSFWSFVAADVCQHAPALQRGRSLFTHYGWSVFSTRSGDITGSQAKVLGFSIEKDCSFIAIYIYIYISFVEAPNSSSGIIRSGTFHVQAESHIYMFGLFSERVASQRVVCHANNMNLTMKD